MTALLSAVVALLAVAMAALAVQRRRGRIVASVLRSLPAVVADGVDGSLQAFARRCEEAGVGNVTVVWEREEGRLARLTSNGVEEIAQPATNAWPDSTVVSRGGRVVERIGRRNGADLDWLARYCPEALIVPLTGARAGVVAVRARMFDGRGIAFAIRDAVAHALTVSAAAATATVRQRGAIARDLHDGPLQSLIASGIHLNAALSDRSPSGEVTVAREALDTGLGELRSIIDDLRPRSRPPHESRLTTRLSLLAATVRQQWGVDVDIQTESLHAFLSARQRREVRQLVREAVINAARHARAKRVTVLVQNRNSDVKIVVADDGEGFSFRGRRTLEELREGGPATLVERVTALGGFLQIDSTSSGSTVEMAIPAG